MKKLNNIFLLLLLILSVLACIPYQSGPFPSLKPGEKASGFSLKNVDGKMVSLSDYKEAKGFIIVFTCNHCPYAKAYEKRLIALDVKYKSKGYPLIAINPNDPQIVPEDSYENMIKNHREKGFTFPYLTDETQEITKAYGASKTPHVYLIQKSESDFIVRYTGGIDDNYKKESEVTEKYVENALNNLLEGKKVKVSETKAIGCTIKWTKKAE
jgi:peroxiredoxin